MYTNANMWPSLRPLNKKRMIEFLTQFDHVVAHQSHLIDFTCSALYRHHVINFKIPSTMENRSQCDKHHDKKNFDFDDPVRHNVTSKIFKFQFSIVYRLDM